MKSGNKKLRIENSTVEYVASILVESRLCSHAFIYFIEFFSAIYLPSSLSCLWTHKHIDL